MNFNALRRNLPLHLMIFPGLIVLIIYQYIPITGLAIAFMDFRPLLGFGRSEWVGWDNFEFVLSLPNIKRVLWNTFYISLMKIILGLIVPITVALLLNEIRRNWYKRAIQTIIYIPHFFSWVILGGILVDLLSPAGGLVNQMIVLFGGKPIHFLSSNDWFPYVLVITNEWKEFGFSTIVYLAALTAINPALYEAAIIDGANRLRQTWHITLPGMLPIIILMATISLGQVLNAGFDQVFNLYSPVVYQSGDIIDTVVYRIGLEQAQYSIASAIGMFKSIVSFLLISVGYLLAYRFANYRIF